MTLRNYVVDPKYIDQLLCGVMRHTLIGITALLITLVVAPVTPAAANPTTPQPPAPPTSTWTLPSADARTDQATAETCAGHFGGINRETDQHGVAYLHWGGYQQCTPSPLPQSLLINLWRLDPDGWDLADVTEADTLAATLLNAFESSLC